MKANDDELNAAFTALLDAATADMSPEELQVFATDLKGVAEKLEETCELIRNTDPDVLFGAPEPGKPTMGMQILQNTIQLITPICGMESATAQPA